MNRFAFFVNPKVPQLDPMAVQARLSAEPQPFILDVRELNEYVEGHISGATLIPLGELDRRMDEIPSDREIVCVCHSGSRSAAATRQLVSAGRNALNMAGGMANWARAGLPMKTGKGQRQL